MSSPSDVEMAEIVDSGQELVNFTNICDVIACDRDLIVNYTVGKSVIDKPRDWIGLFRSGWKSCTEHVRYVWAERVSKRNRRKAHPSRKVILRKNHLLGLHYDGSYFQFVYVSRDNEILGVSNKFMLVADLRVYNLLAAEKSVEDVPEEEYLDGLAHLFAEVVPKKRHRQTSKQKRLKNKQYEPESAGSQQKPTRTNDFAELCEPIEATDNDVSLSVFDDADSENWAIALTKLYEVEKTEETCSVLSENPNVDNGIKDSPCKKLLPQSTNALVATSPVVDLKVTSAVGGKDEMTKLTFSGTKCRMSSAVQGSSPLKFMNEFKILQTSRALVEEVLAFNGGKMTYSDVLKQDPTDTTKIAIQCTDDIPDTAASKSKKSKRRRKQKRKARIGNGIVNEGMIEAAQYPLSVATCAVKPTSITEPGDIGITDIEDYVELLQVADTGERKVSTSNSEPFLDETKRRHHLNADLSLSNDTDGEQLRQVNLMAMSFEISDIIRLKEQAVAMESENDTLRAELENERNKFVELDTKLKREVDFKEMCLASDWKTVANRSIEKKAALVQKQEKTIEALRSEITCRTNQCELLKATSKKLNNDLEKRDRDYNHCEKQLEEFQVKLNVRERDIETLTKDLIASRTSVKSLTEIFATTEKDLKEQIRNLQVKLATRTLSAKKRHANAKETVDIDRENNNLATDSFAKPSLTKKQKPTNPNPNGSLSLSNEKAVISAFRHVSKTPSTSHAKDDPAVNDLSDFKTDSNIPKTSFQVINEAEGAVKLKGTSKETKETCDSSIQVTKRNSTQLSKIKPKINKLGISQFMNNTKRDFPQNSANNMAFNNKVTSNSTEVKNELNNQITALSTSTNIGKANDIFSKKFYVTSAGTPVISQIYQNTIKRELRDTSAFNSSLFSAFKKINNNDLENECKALPSIKTQIQRFNQVSSKNQTNIPIPNSKSNDVAETSPFRVLKPVDNLEQKPNNADESAGASAVTDTNNNPTNKKPSTEVAIRPEQPIVPVSHPIFPPAPTDVLSSNGNCSKPSNVKKSGVWVKISNLANETCKFCGILLTGNSDFLSSDEEKTFNTEKPHNI